MVLGVEDFMPRSYHCFLVKICYNKFNIKCEVKHETF